MPESPDKTAPEIQTIYIGFDSNSLHARYYEFPRDYPKEPTRSIEFPQNRFDESELIIRLASNIATSMSKRLKRLAILDIKDLEGMRALTKIQKKSFMLAYNNVFRYQKGRIL